MLLAVTSTLQERHPITTTARLVSVFKNLGLTSDMKQVDVKVPSNRKKIRQLVTNFKAEITDLETVNEMRDFFATKIIPGYTNVEWDAIDSIQNILTYGWVALNHAHSFKRHALNTSSVSSQFGTSNYAENSTLGTPSAVNSGDRYIFL